MASYMISELFVWMRDIPSARLHVHEARELASRYDIGMFLALITVMVGRVSEPNKESVATMCRGINKLRSAGVLAWIPQSLVFLAELQAELGNTAEGLALVSEALDLVGQTGERLCEAELHRLTGELSLAARGDPLQAVRSFERAVAVGSCGSGPRSGRQRPEKGA
jgi:hypothetical protein